MKWFCILFVFVLFVFPFWAAADIVDPGWKEVDYCFSINNIADYPDYDFFLYSDIGGPPQKIEADECVYFYKFASPRIFALPAGEYDETTLAVGQPLDDQESFLSNPDLIPADIKIESYGQVTVTSPLDSVEDVLTIGSLTPQALEIEKVKRIYTYTDGTIEEEHYQNGQVEGPSWNWSSWWYWLLIPFAVAILIVVLLVWRDKRKRRSA